MHALQLAGLGQFGQVAPDGLQRHAEMLRQPLDGDLAVAAGDLEDLGWRNVCDMASVRSMGVMASICADCKRAVSKPVHGDLGGYFGA